LKQKSSLRLSVLAQSTREIKEYDVQVKGEEGFFSSFFPKTLLTVVIISAIVNVGLYFGFQILSL